MTIDDAPVPHQTTIFRCLRCGVPAQQVWGRLGVSLPGRGGVPDFFDEPSDEHWNDMSPERSDWTSSTCQGCGRTTLWRNNIPVYPAAKAGPPPHDQMPALVRDLYEEARSVLSSSRRAGAALARASLERLLREVDSDAPTDARLDDRIARVSGRVSTGLAETLDVIRYLGNEALHVNDEQQELVYLYLDETEPEIAEFMFASINQLVDELIARPEIARRRFEQLPDGVRESVQRKRAKYQDASE